MRPELQAKLLQHLNKKKADKGFTLVELLVVIVIIGILTAIALPSFLNQTAKAKQSEAKQNISSVIKAQQSWRTENAQFTTAFDDLALGTLRGAAGIAQSTQTFNYVMADRGTPDTTIEITAQSQDVAVKSYSGLTVVANSGGGSQISWTSVICEADVAGNVLLAAPTDTVLGPVANGKQPCTGIAASAVK
jgi:type IV pilus assembly protein PilA